MCPPGVINFIDQELTSLTSGPRVATEYRPVQGTVHTETLGSRPTFVLPPTFHEGERGVGIVILRGHPPDLRSTIHG